MKAINLRLTENPNGQSRRITLTSGAVPANKSLRYDRFVFSWTSTQVNAFSCHCHTLVSSVEMLVAPAAQCHSLTSVLLANRK
jgi:hypothetical protein